MKIIIRTAAYADADIERQRHRWAEELQAMLPGSKIAVDCGVGPYQHFLNVLQMAGDDGCLHVEDDAIISSKLLEQLPRIVEDRPGKIVQFYSRFVEDMNCLSRYDERFCGGVCFFMPGPLNAPIFEFLTNWDRRLLNPNAWDIGIRHWLRETKRHYWLVIPNLADHRCGPSGIDRSRPQDRRSYTFPG